MTKRKFNCTYLSISFQRYLFVLPESMRKPLNSLMFLGDMERYIGKNVLKIKHLFGDFYLYFVIFNVNGS